MLHENDWMAINHLLLKMYSQKSKVLFDNGFIQNLQYLIPFDKASFFLHNHEGEPVLYNPETIGFDTTTYDQYLPLIPKAIPHSWVNFYEKSIVVRDSDVCKTENERMTTEYYNSLYINENIKYALTISLAHNSTRVGIFTLFRESSKNDFTDREINIAENLMDHFACYAYDIYGIEKYAKSTAQVPSMSEMVKEYNLSEREKDVLRLVLTGHSTKEICNRLFITETTAKKHISSIYNKMGIHSRSELFTLLSPQIEIDW